MRCHPTSLRSFKAIVDDCNTAETAFLGRRSLVGFSSRHAPGRHARRPRRCRREKTAAQHAQKVRLEHPSPADPTVHWHSMKVGPGSNSAARSRARERPLSAHFSRPATEVSGSQIAPFRTLAPRASDVSVGRKCDIPDLPTCDAHALKADIRTLAARIAESRRVTVIPRVIRPCAAPRRA
jgi:hypothetical protein